MIISSVMSLTLTFTGNTSVLENHFFPPLELDPTKKWSCGLLNFESYNSIANVNESNNKVHVSNKYMTLSEDSVKDKHELVAQLREKFNEAATIEVGTYAGGKFKFKCSIYLYNYGDDSILLDLGFSKDRVIFEPNVEHISDGPISEKKFTRTKLYIGENVPRIPTGTYEMEDLAKYLKENLGITLTTVENELKCLVKSENYIVFLSSDYNSIGSLLGFKKLTTIPLGGVRISDSIANINSVNVLSIQCSLIKDSYKNGEQSHILHQFFPNIGVGYKLIETPTNIVYLETITNIIDCVTLKIVDQNDRLVDFRGEEITVRLHIKENA